MKNLFFMLLIALTTMPAMARQVTTETLYTCQQEDGDQWVEVGIAMNNGPGFRALVVTHNEDDGSVKLTANRQVFETRKRGTSVFEDADSTLRVTVKKIGRSLSASLMVLQDGPGSISVDRLVCVEKSTITYKR